MPQPHVAVQAYRDSGYSIHLSGTDSAPALVLHSSRDPKTTAYQLRMRPHMLAAIVEFLMFSLGMLKIGKLVEITL